MKNIIVFLSIVIIIGGCASGDSVKIVSTGTVTDEDSLIVKKFTGRNTYLIVCRGFPLPDAEEDALIASAKHAARLNAYYFAEKTFDQTVDVYKDGRFKKFVVKKDFVIAYYEIRKRDLRERMKKRKQ